ncbi:[FeFe] hydrogenase H-cluster radical SAM maturase HydG [Aedoeadaptatus ivorii]|uniref:[FeFe] hydrogenase H-cluster radical SAM maturase HydG n=1 Tax=Aedoeadaptatus ivorii TaxID=54006 RepID=UPI0022B294AB|nr:[FeFe] hydrogenase H-cluster radical SAM maturase HydG [Peptoniphilus ivorii]
MRMYNKMSPKAEDFINHEEILDTLAYAEAHAKDRALQEEILEKGKKMEGLDHREAAVLLVSELPDVRESFRELARAIKKKYYGNRIVLFAPLYLSNYCVNGCVYCPYHKENAHIDRVKLSQEEIEREVVALQDMGHKRLALELGEDPVNNPIEYVLESIRTIYGIKHKNGAIRRVNVNIAATTVENYRKLKEAEIGTYILFQETYHKENYEKLHPKGPKANWAYHTEAMDRAMDGGIDDVGLGVLYGLNSYKYDFIGQLMHAEHLEAYKGVGPHTISVPRIRPADDIDPDAFENGVPDAIFEDIIALIRVAVPYTGMIISTRESMEMRKKALELGVSQISGGSKTSVGGYDEGREEENSAQFDTDDARPLDEVIAWLLELGYLPSFCTACYRAGRTGETFMEEVKNFQIAQFCQPNAIMTLEEYLSDYATASTRALGERRIEEFLDDVERADLREKARENVAKIRAGERDFRF